VIPDPLLLLLSSEYSLFFVILAFLIHSVKQRILLIHPSSSFRYLGLNSGPCVC
jgi:hypothetical protein